MFLERIDSHCVCLKRTSLGSVLDCVALCLEESLLSLAKLRLKKSGRVSLSTLNVWMFGSRTTVKKVRNSLTWFSHGSGASLAPEPLVRVPFSTTRVFETLFS